MTDDRIVQLLEEIRDLQTSQLKIISDIQKQNIQNFEKSEKSLSQSDIFLSELVGQRKKEMRYSKLRSNIMTVIIIFSITMWLAVIVYKWSVK